MTPLANLEARVEAYLGQMGLEGAFRPGGVTTLDAGDVPVLITCFEQDDATWCRVAAVLLTDVAPTLALLHELLQRHHDVLLGAFQLFEDGTLAFSATLHGHNLDADAFSSTLRYVAHVASQQLRALQLVAPGTSWTDAPQEAPPC